MLLVELFAEREGFVTIFNRTIVFISNRYNCGWLSMYYKRVVKIK